MTSIVFGLCVTLPEFGYRISTLLAVNFKFKANLISAGLFGIDSAQ